MLTHVWATSFMNIFFHHSWATSELALDLRWFTENNPLPLDPQVTETLAEHAINQKYCHIAECVHK